jgi:hypothetical protein
MDLLLLQFYRNDICNVVSDTKTQRTYCMLTHHYTKRYPLCVLYNGLMVDWFKKKHVAKAYTRECKLNFDWAFIFFVYWVLVNKYTNTWLQMPAYLTMIFTAQHVLFCVIQFFPDIANKSWIWRPDRNQTLTPAYEDQTPNSNMPDHSSSRNHSLLKQTFIHCLQQQNFANEYDPVPVQSISHPHTKFP